MRNYPIADLHCDLLLYLGRGARSPYDPEVRCAIPQLREGNVKVQVMPLFTETHPGSTVIGQRQWEAFSALEKRHPDVFGKEIKIFPAVENASCFAEEDESLDQVLQRLDSFDIKPFYIGLTWNMENRFGGGAHSSVGLKPDGKALLDFLHNKKICVDFSHASDPLVYETLNYIDAQGLNIPVLASHSNFRAVCDVPRNLPDDLAREIMRRGGVIGLNFVRFFVGNEPIHFVRQLEHALALGGAKHLCFGADFFHLNDLEPPYRKTEEQTYFPGFADATVYPKVIDLWQKQLALPEELLKDIAFDNFSRFLNSAFNTEAALRLC